jgi:hypothetical protein
MPHTAVSDQVKWFLQTEANRRYHHADKVLAALLRQYQETGIQLAKHRPVLVYANSDATKFLKSEKRIVEQNFSDLLQNPVSRAAINAANRRRHHLADALERLITADSLGYQTLCQRITVTSNKGDRLRFFFQLLAEPTAPAQYPLFINWVALDVN